MAMARRASAQPTDGELEILNILWAAGSVELGQICAALRRGRPVATTTVATMLTVMLNKGLVDHAPGPRARLWSAKVSRAAAATGLLGKLIDRVFDGSARRLVAHLLEDGRLGRRDRQEIRRLLEGQKPGK